MFVRLLRNTFACPTFTVRLFFYSEWLINNNKWTSYCHFVLFKRTQSELHSFSAINTKVGCKRLLSPPINWERAINVSLISSRWSQFELLHKDNGRLERRWTGARRDAGRKGQRLGAQVPFGSRQDTGQSECDANRSLSGASHRRNSTMCAYARRIFLCHR